MTDDATTPAGKDRAAAPTGTGDSTSPPDFDTSTTFPSAGTAFSSADGFPSAYGDPGSSSLYGDPGSSSLYGDRGPSSAYGGDSAESDRSADATTSGGAAGSGDGSTPGEERGRPDAATRRRRRLIGAGAAAVILVLCGGLGAFAAVVHHLAGVADDRHEVRTRTDSACLELERRLNRLAPPGAAGNPGQRAAAIRDENTAVAPFLSELDQLRGRYDDEADGGGWAEAWRQLVTARGAYADALDRQAAKGEPAFFLAPRDGGGRSALERLQRGPQSCAGTSRRLAAPDL